MATIVVAAGEVLHIVVEGSDNTFALHADTEDYPGSLTLLQTGGIGVDPEEQEDGQDGQQKSGDEDSSDDVADGSPLILFEDDTYDPDADEEEDEGEEDAGDDEEAEEEE